MKKKILRKFASEYSNRYCEKRKHHFDLQSAQFFNGLIHLYLFSIFKCSCISSKKLKKKYFFTDTSGNYLILNMAVWWDYVSKRERDRGGEGGIDEQPLSDKPPLKSQP